MYVHDFVITTKIQVSTVGVHIHACI